MTIMVRNNDNDIEVIYNNVENITRGAEMFRLDLGNGESATFHYIDADGSEWDCFKIHQEEKGR